MVQKCTVTNAVALGLASGALPNNRITASSYYGKTWEPWRGRLNYTGGGGCWGPKKNRLGEYLQVDLGQVKEIVQFATQGRYNADRWTKAFELGYRVNGSEWTRYEVNGQVKVNRASLSVCRFSLHYPHKTICLVIRIKQMIIHSKLFMIKNQILITCLQRNYRDSLGEFSNDSYGVFASLGWEG